MVNLSRWFVFYRLRLTQHFQQRRQFLVELPILHKFRIGIRFDRQ